mmetsp:Transcript_9026/g.12530  ORF Transcript_9026/g.12530 Transcript_9026/m.12530 type:complete len:92 (+) Transcript_9026:290-565(+)
MGRKLVKDRIALRGPEHDSSILARTALGGTLIISASRNPHRKKEFLKEAKPILLESYQIATRVLGRNHPHFQEVIFFINSAFPGDTLPSFT